MTTATYVLEVDWNNDGDYSDSYEDITADLVEVECERGRDYASQLLGRSSAGRLSAVLRNTSGRYSSFNSGSPIYGNILPGRLVRLRATAPSAVTLWTGYLDSVNPVVSAGQLPQARLTAVGPLSRLVGIKIDAAVAQGNATGTNIGTCLTRAQWSVSARNIDTGTITTDWWWADNEDCLAAIRKLEDTELGFLYEDADGSINFEAYDHRTLHSPHTTSQATFSDAAGAARGYSTISQEDLLRDIYNYVAATFQGYTAAANARLFTWKGAASGYGGVDELPTVLHGGGSLTYWSTYSGGGFVSAWDTPAFGGNAANSTLYVQAYGGGFDPTPSCTVSATKYAKRMSVTITNNHGSYDLGFWADGIRATGVAYTPNNAVAITSEDATSQGKYGFRPLSLSAAWFRNKTDAQTQADRIIARYKDPHPRVTLSIRGNRDSTHMTEALTRKISDRITVVATGNQTQLGINGDFFIENIRHQISQMGGVHVTTFALSPV